MSPYQIGEQTIMPNLTMSTQRTYPSVFREFERNNTNNINIDNRVKSFTATPPKKKDILLDTPLRYLAYTNEIGAAVKPLTDTATGIVKHIPSISYAPVVGYLVADAVDKYNKGEDGTGKKPSIKMAARELGFQTIASVLAPTAVVTSVQKLVGKGAEKLPKQIPDSKVRLAQFAISMVSLLAVSKYIDKGTEKCFEKFVDPILGLKHKKVKEPQNDNSVAKTQNSGVKPKSKKA